MTAWYDHDELKAQADGAQTQPEFDPAAEPADPEDTSWDAMQALLTEHARLATVIAGITQPYPTVSGDDTVTL